ncbi:histone H2A-Bbd type 1-like [Apodemus sylvaticus]|uniref:histone H2A-Bbd type 1-like n=1 Tax=Apodemus sylvaticus TaxID=10129 RepID=UPI002244ACC1|nr:histone H2A-Bbd type 1-like [Apodemus sylvaticus]
MENKRQRKHSTARSSGAEPQFSVSKIERLLQERNLPKRLNSSAPVFLAGVLEYVTSNILDLAGQEAHTSGKKLISPENLTTAVQNNEELRHLFKDNQYMIDATPTPGPIETPGPEETPKADETPRPEEK